MTTRPTAGPAALAEVEESRACREYREQTGARYCDVPCRLCDERARLDAEEGR